MSLTLRIILVLSSIVSFVFCIKKIRTAKLKVENSITWMIGSVILVLMSIFSNAVAWISEKCGFMASSNFVFLNHQKDYDKQFQNQIQLLKLEASGF